MKSKFVPSKPTPPVPQFPCFRQWIGGDGFKGGVVMFTEPRSFIVLFVPEQLDDGPSVLRDMGEIVDKNATPYNNSNYWVPVSGELTLTIP